jgi:hypothetical protein
MTATDEFDPAGEGRCAAHRGAYLLGRRAAVREHARTIIWFGPGAGNGAGAGPGARRIVSAAASVASGESRCIGWRVRTGMQMTEILEKNA